MWSGSRWQSQILHPRSTWGVALDLLGGRAGVGRPGLMFRKPNQTESTGRNTAQRSSVARVRVCMEMKPGGRIQDKKQNELCQLRLSASGL